MSIISEALRKASEKRKDVINLKEEDFRTDAAARPDTRRLRDRFRTKDLSIDIKEIASRKTKWSLLSTMGTLFIVGLALTAFFYNVNYLPSGTNSIAPVVAALKETDAVKGVSSEINDINTIQHLLRLNGVIEGTGEPYAVINNRILKKGESIYGAEVLDISSQKVTMLFKGEQITLQIE